MPATYARIARRSAVVAAVVAVIMVAVSTAIGVRSPAAMFAAILRTALRAAPDVLEQPAELLRRANRLLYEELSVVDMFITAQLVLIDAKKRKLTIASAGHCPGS